MSISSVHFGNSKTHPSDGNSTQALSPEQQFWANYRRQSALNGAPVDSYALAKNDDQFVPQSSKPADTSKAEPSQPAQTADNVSLAKAQEPSKDPMTPIDAFINGLPSGQLVAGVESILRTRLPENAFKEFKLDDTAASVLPNLAQQPEALLETIVANHVIATLHQRGELDKVNLSPPQDEAEKATLVAARDNFLNSIKSVYSPSEFANLISESIKPIESLQTSETQPEGSDSSKPSATSTPPKELDTTA
ncbi:MAG: hypothetical protein VKK59_00580 [Vampirovibrionales bacterium]|nr:hypothetical protein [Vampirovibrionales bacterium]